LLTPEQIQNFVALFEHPPQCVCGKKLALFKGLQKYIPKSLQPKLREMTEANGFAFATFYTRGKGNIGRPENCAHCINLAKTKLVAENKDKNLECEKCHCRLFFDDDPAMRASLANPTIRAKRNYGRVKLTQVKQKGIFQAWSMKLQCAGSCQKKPQGVCFAGNAKSGQYLLENWHTHGQAMNQVFDQHLTPEERQQVQKQVEEKAIHNVCKSLGVATTSQDLSGISFYTESLVQDKSLCQDPYDRVEIENFKLITSKVRQFFDSETPVAEDQRRILRLLVLLQYLAQKYERNELQINATEFGEYAQAQGWWLRQPHHIFSEQFVVTRFTSLKKEERQSSVMHVVDTTEHPMKWILPKRVWNRLYPYFKCTMIPGEQRTYLQAIQELRPPSEGWGEYKSTTQSAPEVTVLEVTAPEVKSPETQPSEDEKESPEVQSPEVKSPEEEQQQEIQRIKNPHTMTRVAQFIRKAILEFGPAPQSSKAFETLCASVNLQWFPHKLSTTKTQTNATFCHTFPYLIASGYNTEGHLTWRLNPLFFH
jgi:hypothetical protein